MSRHPREVRERMEGEVMILITGEQALRRLTDDCRFPEAKARRILNIAWEFGQKAEPCPGGYVHVWYHGKDDTDTHIYSVVEHIGEKQSGKVARGKGSRYTQPIRKQPERKAMPPRKTRTAKPAPEPEPAENGEVDYQKYVEKTFSPTMNDYIEWFEANVASLDELAVDKILVLGVSMYSHFQKSDFNIERREQRAAERTATRAPASEPEEDEAPARTRKAPGRAAKPAPAATARSSARSGNGRAAKPSGRKARASAGAAAGGGDAPF